jgi:hypothetical protein
VGREVLSEPKSSCDGREAAQCGRECVNYLGSA